MKSAATKMRRLRLLSFALFSLSQFIQPCWAGSEAGRENLFLLGVDARALGMGGAFVSVTDGASSVYWNPAGLALLDRGEASFLHVSLWEETVYDFLGLAYPTLDFGSVGIGVFRLGTSDIPRRDASNLDLGRFDNTISLYSVSLASSFPFSTKGGMSFKIYNQSLAGNTAIGVGLDLGILATPSEHFSWGVNLQDLLRPTLQLTSKKERIPFNLKAGASYSQEIDLVSIILAADLDKTQDREIEFHLGAEIGLQDAVFLRGGYDRDYTTWGGGVKWNWLRADYALKTQPDLGVTHRLSLTIQFGQGLDSRRLAKEEKAKREAEAVHLKAVQQKKTAYLAEAEQSEERGDFFAALESYHKVLALDSGHKFAAEKTEALRGQIESSSQERSTQIARATLIEINLSKARELYQKGSYKLAGEHTRETLDLDPANSEALALQQNIQLAQAERISQLQTEAKAFYATGDIQRAILIWTQLLDLDSTNLAAQAGLRGASTRVKLNAHIKSGIEYFNSGNYSAAQQELFSAVTISPGDPVATDYLQKVRAKLEKTTTLEDLKKDPQIWQLYQEGLERYQSGDYQGALQAWQEVLKVYPNNKNTLRNVEQAKQRLK